MLNIKELKIWLNNSAGEDFKAFKSILKNDYNITSKAQLIGESLEIGSGDEENLAWGAGYISALKAVIRNMEKDEERPGAISKDDIDTLMQVIDYTLENEADHYEESDKADQKIHIFRTAKRAERILNKLKS